MSALCIRRNDLESEWEDRRETIKRRYCSDGKTLEGPDGVIATMATLYGFSKTKSQYERRFKRWKFRKNRNAGDWKRIGEKIQMRKEAGRDSIVFLNGQLVPQSKVRKETSRYGFALGLERAIQSMTKPRLSSRRVTNHFCQATAACTPEGFTVLTPVADIIEPVATFDLPFVEFEVSLRTIMDSHLANPKRSANIDYTTSSGLPFFSRDSFAPNFALTLPGIALPETSPARVPQHVATTHLATVIPLLRSLLPFTALGECCGNQSLATLNTQAVNSAYLRLLVFAVANNFAGVNGLQHKQILEYVRSKIGLQLPILIQSIPGPTAKALAEKLFQCAIEAGDALVVEGFLQYRQTNIDVNEHTCIFWQERFTPVELSAALHDLTIAKMLIRYRADVNRTFPRRLYGLKGALGCCLDENFWPSKLPPHHLLELVSTLLDAGAKIEPDVLDTAISWHNAGLVDVLISVGASSNHESWSRSGLFCRALGLVDSTRGNRIVRTMLEVNADMNHLVEEKGYYDIDPFRVFRRHHEAPEYSEIPKTVLDAVAQRGDFDLFRLLRRSGAFLTSDTLVCAIRSTNMDLVQSLLEEGVKVDRFASFPYTTPFSQAISSGNAKLIQLLIQKGAMQKIKEKSRFTAALNATSECGDVGLVQSLLEIGADANQSSLFQSLVTAIKTHREEVAMILISAGACELDDYQTKREGSPLKEALKSRNSVIVRALLRVNVPFSHEDEVLPLAIEFGDYSIVEELIFAGAEINYISPFESWFAGGALRSALRSSQKSEMRVPLTIAVQKQDKSLVELLIAHGADVNNCFEKQSGFTALEAAVTNGDINMVRYLLRHGADPHNTGALLKAVSGTLELMHLLFEAFECRYPRGRKGYGSEALRHAIKMSNVPMIHALLKKRVDPNWLFPPSAQSMYKKTAFGLTIKRSEGTNLKEVQLLLNHGADPNSIALCTNRDSAWRTLQAHTAFLIALGFKKVPIVQVLLDHGANVNSPATRGVMRTPLQRAAETGSLEIVQILLEKGAHVNGEPAYNGGATALQLAAIGGYVGIAWSC